ncbi:MAG: thiolase family protein [Acidimicrobiia bacterium]
MTERPEQRAVLAGIGISRIGRRTGTPGIDLTGEASAAAIADAGLRPADIDGVASLGDTPVAEAASALGIQPTYTGGGTSGGGLLAPVMDACTTVGEGRARHVLVYRTVQMIGGAVVPVGDAPPPRANDEHHEALSVMGDMGPLIAHHAYSAANFLALHCQRHMYLHGTTKEQLGWLAVSSRQKASLNPLAVRREPMTIDDYLAARLVSTPFGLYDCDVPVDGSIAFVVSTADHAPSCPQPPIRVAAMGGAPGARGGWVDRPDYPKMASADAAATMWSRTDLRPGDVDVAELYDGFTFLTFAWLEALGFCADGEAGFFVEGGTRIALDGELPLNTYGGQLSAGRMHGYWVLHEACLQLRGQAGERQVPGAPEVAAVSNGGGPIAGCMLVTR